MFNLIEHPELTSKLILRAEMLWDSDNDEGNHREGSTILGEDGVATSAIHLSHPRISGYRHTRTIVRRLCAKVPERDVSIIQQCFVYDGEESGDMVVILKPSLDPGVNMPFYHPQVGALAFRYVTNADGASESEPQGTIHLDVLPLRAGNDGSTSSSPQRVNERDKRTCIILLETIAKHGWGAYTGYKKRVQHDLVIARSSYQDYYHEMKIKYKHLTSLWAESTDPIKNVFEVSHTGR